MRLPSIKFNKIKEFLRKFFRTLAEKTFFTFLGLFFLALIFGTLLFYKNVILVKKAQPEISAKLIQLNEKLLEEILGESENRQKKFEETELKEYPDPFWRITPPPEETGPEEESTPTP